MLQALRRLGKSPGFTLFAVATLAPEIVSSALVFSALNGGSALAFVVTLACYLPACDTGRSVCCDTLQVKGLILG